MKNLKCNCLVKVNFNSRMCYLFIDGKEVGKWSWDNINKLSRMYKRYEWVDISGEESLIDLNNRIK